MENHGKAIGKNICNYKVCRWRYVYVLGRELTHSFANEARFGE
jgi:hypothetical protein